MFELWAFSLIRTVILFGSAVGTLRNSTDAVPRIKKFTPMIILLSVIMYAYPLVKMLLFTDQETNLAKPWFWSLFAFSIVGAFNLNGCWTLLSKIIVVKEQILNVNIQDETSPLLNGPINEEDEKEAKKEKEEIKWNRANVLRLISYSKNDILYIMVGFTFLLIASGCKYNIILLG